MDQILSNQYPEIHFYLIPVNYGRKEKEMKVFPFNPRAYVTSQEDQLSLTDTKTEE